MESIHFDFFNLNSRLLISVDSLVESFTLLENEDAVIILKHMLNEYHLHKQGINVSGSSTYKTVPVKPLLGDQSHDSNIPPRQN